jgi:endoglycosylceramidase
MSPLPRFLFGLLMLFLAASCGDGSRPAPQGGLPLLRAESDVDRGGWIADAQGREVHLRGVNVNSFVDYWSGNEFPTTFPFLEADAERMREVGWNAVRLLLSWSRVEPEPGRYDERYLDEIGAAVEVLARNGIYSILDMHQDAWSATLAARPDENCPPFLAPAIGWDGAPAWATFDEGKPRCVPGGFRDLTDAVISSWRAFFRDAEGPGGIGIRTRYARMWGHVAERFARSTAIAGYDLMNEPGAYSDSDLEGLSAMYADALAEIRAGERRAGGPSHIVFFEPGIAWTEPPPDFARDQNVAYAPHIYEGGFDNLAITEEPFERALAEAQGFGGIPVLVGEWGTNPDRAGPDGDGYFRQHQSLQDEFGFSATLWTWRESCGDPHKVRESGVPVPWGEFEVDCRTNEILGEREALFGDLTRAYARAAPGRVVRMSYDDEERRFEVVGHAARAGQVLEVFLPSGVGEGGTVAAQGLGEIEFREVGGGGHILFAAARGGAGDRRGPGAGAGARPAPSGGRASIKSPR